jgi:hypothetical protein
MCVACSGFCILWCVLWLDHNFDFRLFALQKRVRWGGASNKAALVATAAAVILVLHSNYILPDQAIFHSFLYLFFLISISLYI